MTLLFLLSCQNMTLMCSNFMVCCQPFEKMLCSCRKIRPCPSTNPGCVSTNPKSSSFAFPWTIPENSSGNAIQVQKIYAFTYRKFYFFWINLNILKEQKIYSLDTQTKTIAQTKTPYIFTSPEHTIAHKTPDPHEF